MADDMDDGAEPVFESWEDLVDTGLLDKKIEEMKSRQPVEQSEIEISASIEPVILQEDVPRTQYVPPQPQVKILKRPSGVTKSEGSLLVNGEKSSKQPIKTLQQREAEYAEARLRILGAAKNEEEIAEERLANITLAAVMDCPKVTEAAQPLESLRLVDAVQVIRAPRGPDATKGFSIRR